MPRLSACHRLVTTGAIAGIYARLMRFMTQSALVHHLAVAHPGVERVLSPIRVASGTGFRGVRGYLLDMWIVTHPAGTAVRILERVVIPGRCDSAMTDHALLRARDQRSGGRVAGGKSRDVRGELVACDTMQRRRLRSHFTQGERKTLVAAALTARS
jgi:hypothetical protein